MDENQLFYDNKQQKGFFCDTLLPGQYLVSRAREI
jgi:hypothetical protein